VTRHDILNQLTVLIGYLELSRQDISDPGMLTYIDKEKKAADMIRSQILFTRDYQNIGVYSPQWHNIAETVSLATASIDPSQIIIRANLPQTEVYADPLLEKVFFNLIDNSIRHGEHVTEFVVRCDYEGDDLQIIIEDNGVGVPETEKEKIFRREYFKNTGFGLFLSREILAITNMTIHENGTPGKGARFVIQVPRAGYRNPLGDPASEPAKK
jgi:signal transduction histidine kinase